MLRMTGHGGAIYSLAFSPDSSMLASGSADTTVKLWEAGTNKEKATLTGHTHVVRQVAFSPNGEFLASAGADTTVRLWELRTLKEVHHWGGEAGDVGVRSVAFSPDARLLAGGYDLFSGGRGALVWNLATHETVDAHRSSDDIRALSWSPDGKTLALGAWFNGVILWEPKRGSVKEWNTGGNVRSVAWSPDGTTLVAGAGTNVEFWDVASGRSRVLEGHASPVWSVAFSADGSTVLSAGNDGVVCAWDPRAGHKRNAWTWDVGKPNCVAIAANGMLAACGGPTGEIMVWDLG